MFVLLLFVLAISLAGVAAFYSIYGLIAIYPAVAFGIFIGAVVIELCKLATISFYYQFYDILTKPMKAFAGFFIIVAMSITSLGVYGFLSKGYIEQTAPLHSIQLQLDNIESDIISKNERIERNKRQVAVLDSALERYIELGAVTKGMQTMREEHGGDYKILQDEISQFQNEIIDLNREKMKLRGELNQVEAEVGAIKYIADIFMKNEDPNVARDTALKWLSILIMIAIDPFAVALLVFANHAYKYRNDERVRREINLFSKKEENTEDLGDMLLKVEEFLREKDGEVLQEITKNETVKYDEVVEVVSEPVEAVNPQLEEEEPDYEEEYEESFVESEPPKKVEQEKPNAISRFFKTRQGWIGGKK